MAISAIIENFNMKTILNVKLTLIKKISFANNKYGTKGPGQG